VAVGVLWVFTILNPGAVVIQFSDTLAITTMMATVIATVFAVLAYWGSEVL